MPSPETTSPPLLPAPRDGSRPIPGGRHRSGGAGARMGWLDALRGIAATAVLISHMLPWFAPRLTPSWIALGTAGVLVFFLVSGYIIPASLERRGCVRSFWTSRLFRLYPLYLVAILFALACAPLVPIHKGVDPIAHITMLMSTVGSARIVDPMWTLAYEMIFYLLVTALFVTGAHRRSGLIAILCMGLAIGVGMTLANGPLPGPRGLLSGMAPLVSLVLVVIGLACVLSGRLPRTGALVLGATALSLAVLGPVDPWLGPTFLAVMFTGTAIHRWEHGRRSAIWAVPVVAVLVCLTPFVSHPAPSWTVPQKWIPTLAAAGVVFAIGMALRHRRVPGFLTWLGRISYSLYLLHYPVLLLFVAVLGDPKKSPAPTAALVAGLYLAVLFGLCALTYRYVELPMQRLGRLLAAQLPSVGDSAKSPASPVGESEERSLSSAAPAG
ncbi:acyltransferase family protein [Planobispora takensis]|nr:acyltransferase [Planobispora takensis]